jgi:two-component system, OmpR family, sensor kinase
MISLRRGVLIWATGLITVIAVASILATRHVAMLEVDKLLDNELQQIAVNAGQGLSQAAFVPLKKTEIENRVAVQVWGVNGELIHQSSGTDQLPRSIDPGFADMEAGGNLWRVYTATDGMRFAQVAQRRSARLEIANHAAAAAAVPLLAALPIAWIVAILGINFLLRRVEGFASTLAVRSVEASGPIGAYEMPREFSPMIAALNSLIDKHRTAVEQQKQFVSEAAHELRTPLAALQIQVDNLRSLPNAESIGELGMGIRRASTMVAQLLRMARLEAPRSPEDAMKVDLGALVLSIVAELFPASLHRGVKLAASAPEGLFVKTSDPEARLLLSNLIDNAIRYTPCGGDVEVRVEQTDSALEVRIFDSGIGIPSESISRVFDRFYRAAPPDIEGTGLGLAIAKKVAERNGYTLTISNRTDVRGVLARVLIPCDD